MNLIANNKNIFLVLVIILGSLILFPCLNFHENLSQGDHGRDLYSFKLTYEGAVPYRDYWTQNGPLMPYYYSLFFRMFGPTIQSVLLGYNFLVLLTGILIYLACVRFLKPLTSLYCAAWYWVFRGTEMFYTFNHIGAICLLAGVILALFHHITTKDKLAFFSGYFFSLLIIFIRPNIGIATMVGYFVSCLLNSFINQEPLRKKALLINIISLVVVLSASFIIYKIFLIGAPPKALSSDLNYLHQAHTRALLKAPAELTRTLLDFCSADWFRSSFTVVFLACLFWLPKNIQKIHNKQNRKTTLLVLFSLGLFTFLVLCEFLFGLRWFRYRWVFVPFFILIFLIIDLGMRNMRRSFQLIVNMMIITTLAVSLASYFHYLSASKKSSTLLSIGTNRVYLLPSQKQWLSTVSQTVAYIKNAVPVNEKILAVRYMPLYYFLSERNSSVREFDVTQQYFKKTINTLEEVNYLLLSNRDDRSVISPAELEKHGFENVATFGPWEKPATWITNHAVKIYQRKK